MTKIEYTPIALRDKQSIASYYAIDCKSPRAAANAVKEIDAIETLKTIPRAGRIVDDERLEQAGYRRIAAGSYWVFYRIRHDEHDVVVIQRILHQRRDLTPRSYFEIDFPESVE